MPKLKRGSGGRRHGCKAKQGTKNKHQVAARDERQAAAIAAVGIMADEALEGLLSSPQATEEEVLVSPLIEPACEPAKGELDAYKRMAIVSAYQRLKCPPESECKHGNYPYIKPYVFCHVSPKYGHFFAVTL